MLKEIHPKLPMRNPQITLEFYVGKMGFKRWGGDFPGYLMIERDAIQIHFFEFRELDPNDNYGQVYIRTNEIDELYKSFIKDGIKIHPNGRLETKLWGQREFSILDPDNNLLIFGEAI